MIFALLENGKAVQPNDRRNDNNIGVYLHFLCNAYFGALWQSSQVGQAQARGYILARNDI
jgi:hypothetical protein